MFRKKEIDFFNNKLSGHINYFEYGAGNSTALASKIDSISNIFSVDSCYTWINDISNLIENINKNVIFIYCDLNSNCKNLGAPVGKSKSNRWKTYPESISYINSDLDFVLIDGRFRVACAIQTYLNVSEQTKIMIHDYDRKEYFIVEEFFDKIDQVETLAMFEKKKSIAIDLNELYKTQQGIVT